MIESVLEELQEFDQFFESPSSSFKNMRDSPTSMDIVTWHGDQEQERKMPSSQRHQILDASSSVMGETSKIRVSRHRRARNVAMGSQEFFDQVLKAL
jgi:hypothetical protein